MMPTSIPAQIVPTTDPFPLSDLNLFVEFTRESYEAAFGVDAPTEDTTQPNRGWFDTSANPGPYGYYNQSGNSYIEFSVKNPGAPNLPGINPNQYPAYVVTDTQATRNGTVMDKNTLSTFPQWMDMLSLWNSLFPAFKFTADSVNFASDVYPTSEVRRPYALKASGLNGTPIFLVGEQLVIQYQFGVGAPGSWQLVNGIPGWVDSSQILPVNTNPPAPMPQRQLVAGESFVVEAGNVLMVTRSGATPPVMTPVGSLADQAASIANTERLVKLIAAAMGIS